MKICDSRQGKEVIDINKINSLLEICPDQFQGSDIEKLQQALDKAILNEKLTPIIKLNRLYDLTGGSVFIDKQEFWGNIRVQGGGITKNDEGCVLDCALEYEDVNAGMNHNSLLFSNCTFSSTAPNCYLTNGNRFIRQVVDDCRFEGIALLKSEVYTQSPRVHNCIIENIKTNFIETDMIYDGVVAHCIFKGANEEVSAIKCVRQTTDTSFFGFRIKDCVFEGFNSAPPIIIGGGHGLQISGNVFKNNQISIQHAPTPTATETLSGEIANNTFLDNTGAWDIKFKSNNARDCLRVVNNVSNQPKNEGFLVSHRISGNSDNETNYMINQGEVVDTKQFSYKQNTGFPNVTQIDLGEEGTQFEIPLNINYYGNVWLADNQFLSNITFYFGEEEQYSGHLTLLLSLDGFWNGSAVVQGLMSTVLSEKNTSGNLEVTTPSYSCIVKENEKTYVNSDATKVTIVITLPKIKYSLKNNCNFKNINSLLVRYPSH